LARYFERVGKFHSCNVIRIEMQLHFYATARRRSLSGVLVSVAEFPARYYSHAGNSNSLSPYRGASVSHSSRLNQNSQDVAKTGALNSLLQNGETKWISILCFVNFVKSLEQITILLF